VEWAGRAFIVRDGGSANGTLLNGARVTDSPLGPGDRLGVGEFTVVVSDDADIGGESTFKTMFMEAAAPGQGQAHFLRDGAPVPVDRAVFTIGKGKMASLRLRAWLMKAIQATVIRETSGDYRLLPVSGGRAVRVNGQAVAASGVMLKTGDQVQLGGHTLTFVLADRRSR
jgi:pSer/pThr/pTyr-binding forkhead associated (FHA) protein